MDPCENQVLSRASSPDGAKDAIVFVRDCGATTSYSTQVSVVPKGTPFLTTPTEWSSTPSGNALIVSGGDRKSPATVEVEWAGNGRLVIRRDSNAEVFVAEASVLSVALEYEERFPK